jgi:hypothetical protein
MTKTTDQIKAKIIDLENEIVGLEAKRDGTVLTRVTNVGGRMRSGFQDRDAVQAEIDVKKRQLEALKASISPPPSPGTKKQTKQQLVYEAVEAWKAAHPGESQNEAIEEVGLDLGMDTAAAKAAYYREVKKRLKLAKKSKPSSPPAASRSSTK